METVKKLCVDFLKAALYISSEYNEEQEALIGDLDLEFCVVEKRGFIYLSKTV